MTTQRTPGTPRCLYCGGRIVWEKRTHPLGWLLFWCGIAGSIYSTFALPNGWIAWGFPWIWLVLTQHYAVCTACRLWVD